MAPPVSDDLDTDGTDSGGPGDAGPPSGATPSPDETSDPGDGYDALPRGTTLGKYSILGRIHETDAEVLYAAFDADSQRKIAIKLLRVAVTDDDQDEQQALVRIARETQRIAKLDHPCIVRVYEVGLYRNRVFVAMEFIDGIDLRHWMEARDDPFPWPEVLRVFHEAGRGLSTAHQSGVVHRDFKPANVILGKSGRICVLNFGLAREALGGKDDNDISELRSSLSGEMLDADDDSAAASHAGTVFGTPAYIAPEQHVSNIVDHRSDQFSFCVALYEALYGERPFSGTRPIALALAAVNHKIRPAPTASDVPGWLRAVVLKGLSPSPEDRYPSMEALLRDLASDPRASRRRWVIGGVAVLAVIAVGLGMVQLREAEKNVCAPDIAALNGVWDLQHRATLQAAIGATHRPWAATTWNTVEDHVDEWTNVWTRGTQQVCLATRSWGTVSEQVYQQRRECLDRHLGELAALGRIVDTPSQDVVDHAYAVAIALRSPRLCGDDDALARRPVPSEGMQGRVATLGDELADVRAYLAAGQHAIALRQATELENAVEATMFAPLQVEVVVLRGRALVATGELAAAQTSLHRAATLATAAGLEAESAEAFIELASVLRRRGQAEEAQRLLDYASGLVTRLRLWHLGPALALVQGKVAIAQGKPSVALSKYYRAIKLESNRIDAHPLRVVPMWIDLGRLLIAQGDPATAATHFGDALTILEQTLGPQHPMIAETLVELAIAQAAIDDGAQAIISLRRAVDVRRQVDDPASLGMVQLRLGDALLSHDSPALSIMRFKNAEASFASAALPSRRAEAIFGRGLAELAQGADAAAAETLARAVTRTEELGDAIALADARFALARALWHDSTQHTRALSLAALARQAYAAAGPDSADSSTAVRQWAAAQTQPPVPDVPATTQTPDSGAAKADESARPQPSAPEEAKP